MAAILRTDGTLEKIGHNPGLKACQGAVGGFIEGVPIVQQDPHVRIIEMIGDSPKVRPLGEWAYMYVNEEGRLRQLHHNMIASDIACQPIVGDVVLLDDSDYESSTKV